MKKSFITVGTLVLVLTFSFTALPAPLVDPGTVLAACQISNSSTDDGNFFASCSRSSSLRIRNTSWADLFIDTNNISNSGNNIQFASEDSIDSNTTTGAATATTNLGASAAGAGSPAGVDVNSTLIGLGDAGTSTDLSVLIDSVSSDDGNVVAVSSDSENESITNTLGAKDVEQHDQTANTGGNTQGAAHDLIGADQNTGVATTTFTKSIVLNFFQLLRNFSL
jgi:hypothetical protein